MTSFRPVALVMALGTATVLAGSASATGLKLPKDLHWCEPLPSVAEKLGIGDTSEAGNAYRADGEYLIRGDMFGEDGNYTVRFDEYGDDMFLIEVEWRMFRLQKSWDQIIAKLTKTLGEGTRKVVASASYDPNGGLMSAERTEHSWEADDGSWAVTARQMSNEIDMVKITFNDKERCKPEDWGKPAQAAEDTSSKSRDSGDIFDYDPYATDPLAGDAKTQELLAEEEKAEEEKKAEEDAETPDWMDDADDVEVDW